MHPQTLSVVQTRAEALELEIEIGPIENADLASRDISGILLQYPDTFGDVKDFEDIAGLARKNGVSFYFIHMKCSRRIINLQISYRL